MKSTFIFSILLILCLGINTIHAQALACRSTIYVDLGNNCQISITPDVIGVNLNPDYDYSLSKSEFSCTDNGHSQTVTLLQHDRATGELLNSCFSEIIVTSSAEPSPCERSALVCHSELNVELNDEGYVVLTPDMISAVPLDENPYFVYDVVPNVLDCSNIGPNTVRLRVVGACFPEDYCTMTVNVIDNREFRPTCYYVNTEGINFYPADLGQLILPPGTGISYSIDLFSQSSGINGLNAEFKILLSKDKVPDPKDVLVHKQNINLGKKTSASGKFILPKKLEPGTYYLIANLISKNKKFRISFPNQIQSIHIGNSSKFGEITTRNSESSDQQERIIIYPNPFQNEIQIVPTDENDPLSEIELYNSLGLKLKSLDVRETSFEVSDLHSGVYFIRYSSLHGQKGTYKVIKY